MQRIQLYKKNYKEFNLQQIENTIETMNKKSKNLTKKFKTKATEYTNPFKKKKK